MWAPGVITGTLCVIVIVLFRFLPETKGKELPHTLNDIDEWENYSEEKKSTKGHFGQLYGLSIVSEIIVGVLWLRKGLRFVHSLIRTGIMSAVRAGSDWLNIITKVSYVDVDGRSEASI